MPTKLTFSTKSTPHGWTTEHSLLMPETAEDTDLIVERYGSMERLINRANAQWKVDAQTGMREQETAEAARAYADGFCDDGRKGGSSKAVVVDTSAQDAPEFTPEQLAFLKKAGAITK